MKQCMGENRDYLDMTKDHRGIAGTTITLR